MYKLASEGGEARALKVSLVEAKGTLTVAAFEARLSKLLSNPRIVSAQATYMTQDPESDDLLLWQEMALVSGVDLFAFTQVLDAKGRREGGPR